VILPGIPQPASLPRRPPIARRNEIWIMVKRVLFVSLTIGMVTVGCVVYPPAAWAATLTLQSKGEVLAVMKKVADHAQSRYPANTEAFWDDGVYHIGMMALDNVANDNAVNDYIQYSVGVPAPGTYNVKVRFGKDTDLGKWQFYTAGINLGVQQDAYSGAFTFSEVNLGNVTYQTSGNKVFRYTVTGKNGASSGSGMAIDYVMLTKQ
jgi:hypothetical protein